jgi:hypothetical protein
MKYLYALIAMIVWVAGWTLAKGGYLWLAIFVPPYSWYLVVSRVIVKYHLL